VGESMQAEVGMADDRGGCLGVGSLNGDVVGSPDPASAAARTLITRGAPASKRITHCFQEITKRRAHRPPVGRGLCRCWATEALGVELIENGDLRAAGRKLEPAPLKALSLQS
jgi:hypothetical protein